ncbi:MULTISPECIES: hypothetical protein [Serratia]|jgi:hypothetical protein|uniref:hypothetical protein n=1 Tax=Serratia TaxID=613 RepID=UPI0013013CCE|nr:MULTISPECIES: hypothetical protein [Serratia]QXN65250.1 hypothetical protein J8M99_26170 [Serratia fonticola]
MDALAFFMLAVVGLLTGLFLYAFKALGLLTRARAMMLVCTGLGLMAGAAVLAFG